LAHHLDIFAGALRATFERDAECSELFRRPSDTDAERDPAAAQRIDTRDRFGENQRVALRHQADAGREANPAGACGDITHRDEGIGEIDIAGGEKLAVVRVGIGRFVVIEEHDMLGRPERREAEPIGMLRNELQCAWARALAHPDSADTYLHLYFGRTS